MSNAKRELSVQRWARERRITLVVRIIILETVKTAYARERPCMTILSKEAAKRGVSNAFTNAYATMNFDLRNFIASSATNTTLPVKTTMGTGSAPRTVVGTVTITSVDWLSAERLRPVMAFQEKRRTCAHSQRVSDSETKNVETRNFATCRHDAKCTKASQHCLAFTASCLFSRYCASGPDAVAHCTAYCICAVISPVYQAEWR